MNTLFPCLVLLVFSVIFLCWLVWQNYLADNNIKRLREELAMKQLIIFYLSIGADPGDLYPALIRKAKPTRKAKIWKVMPKVKSSTSF